MKEQELVQDKLRGLSSVRVNKDFLLKKLVENRDNHEKDYEAVLEARHTKVIEVLKTELKKVKEDKTYVPVFYVQLPENHIKEYDRTIALLGASLDKEFELTSSEFNQYVNDEWGWKGNFLTISGCYSSYNIK